MERISSREYLVYKHVVPNGTRSESLAAHQAAKPRRIQIKLWKSTTPKQSHESSTSAARSPLWVCRQVPCVPRTEWRRIFTSPGISTFLQNSTRQKGLST